MTCARIKQETTLNPVNIESKYEFSNCQDMKKYIEILSKIVQQEQTRFLNEDQLGKIYYLCQALKANPKCQCDPMPLGDSLLAADIFRCLRNSCVHSEDNQYGIVRYNGLYNCLVDCFKVQLKSLVSSKYENEPVASEVVTALRCGMQFFGNLVVSNDTTKCIVWKTFSEESANLFRMLLACEDDKIVDYTAMVLFNTLNEENLSSFQKVEYFTPLINLLINGFISRESHWCLLLIEKFLEQPSFFLTYKDLVAKNKAVVLDVISEQLSTESPTVSEFFLEELSNLFVNVALDIVIALNADENEKPSEIVKTLGVLCLASVSTKFQNKLQSNSRLLETAIDVLKAVHNLGKTSSNVFSPVQSLKQQTEEGLAIESSPAYGFKRDLIRLIGNLCADCKIAQDAIRDQDGIPLLLDCCNMDAKNPFIIQWCTLAIRNLMNNNADNQAILASITVTGELTNSPLLREMGFHVKQEPNGEVKLHKL